MRLPRTGVALSAVLAAMVATGSCNRGAAEESLQAAEQMLETARPDLERYAPEELATLSQALADARADVEAGQYTRALRVAQRLPSRIRTALAVAARRKRGFGTKRGRDVSRGARDAQRAADSRAGVDSRARPPLSFTHPTQSSRSVPAPPSLFSHLHRERA